MSITANASAHKLAAISSARGFARPPASFAVTVTFAKSDFFSSVSSSLLLCHLQAHFLSISRAAGGIFSLGLSSPVSLRRLCIHNISARLSHSPLRSEGLCSSGKNGSRRTTVVPLNCGPCASVFTRVLARCAKASACRRCLPWKGGYGCAYLLVVFDVVLQDDAVGLVGFVPHQNHAVLTGVLLANG